MLLVILSLLVRVTYAEEGSNCGEWQHMGGCSLKEDGTACEQEFIRFCNDYADTEYMVEVCYNEDLGCVEESSDESTPGELSESTGTSDSGDSDSEVDDESDMSADDTEETAKGTENSAAEGAGSLTEDAEEDDGSIDVKEEDNYSSSDEESKSESTDDSDEAETLTDTESNPESDEPDESDDTDEEDDDEGSDDLTLYHMCLMINFVISDKLEVPKHNNLKDANLACIENPSCAGVTFDPNEEGLFTLRSTSGISGVAFRGEDTWVKQTTPCNEIPESAGGGSPDGAPKGAILPVPDYCISNCSSPYSFVKTFNATDKSDSLCENAVTQAVSARGEDENCRTDGWLTVQPCDKQGTCQEFLWRGSHPEYCDVEDRWMWCCDPKIEIEDLTTCQHNRYGEIMCLVHAQHNRIDNIKISWLDENGHDVAYASGYKSKIEFMKVDNDKAISVLSVVQPAIHDIGVHPITCKVTDDTKVWESVGYIRVFDVVASDVTIPRDIDTYEYAEVECNVPGSQSSWQDDAVTWFVTTADGQFKIIKIGDEYPGYEISIDRSGDIFRSVLKVSQEQLLPGEQRVQCQVRHQDTDKCGMERNGCIEEDYAIITVWDLLSDNYCAHVNEDNPEPAYVRVVVEGSTPDWNVDVVQFTTPGGNKISTAEPVKGYKIHQDQTNNGELVAILEISSDYVTKAGSFVYKVNVTYDGKSKEIDSTLHVMDITASPGLPPKEQVLNTGSEPVVVQAEVQGGTLKNPVWKDSLGNIYRIEDQDPNFVVKISDDKTKTFLYMEPDFARRNDGSTTYYVTVDMVDKEGNSCSKGFADVPIDLTTGCHVVWEDVYCDEEKVSCYETEHERVWNCVCQGVKTEKAQCLKPEPRVYTCPATKSFKVTSWSEENCYKDECYPYRETKTRSCVCTDEVGDHEDAEQCPEHFLYDFYYCPATKKWELTDWDLGTCDDGCYESKVLATRDCVCGEFSNDKKCIGEDGTEAETSRYRTCPPTLKFEWASWSLEDCNGERCYDEVKKQPRVCKCRSIEDPNMCEGDSEKTYVCPATLKWEAVVETDACEAGRSAEKLSCVPFMVQQYKICKCRSPDDFKDIIDNSKCELRDLVSTITCPANKKYEWSEWKPVTECDPCFPERPQKFNRVCNCDGSEDPSHSKCEGNWEKSEPCATPRTRMWLPTEWVQEPCTEYNCRAPETTTTRRRECMCGENVDNSRCPETMTEVIDCGLAPFEWTEWTTRPCPSICLSVRTKRYRKCKCHEEIDFNMCEGAAIEFPQCPLPARCL